MNANPQALVFDAYGTLFDVHSVTRLADSYFPGKGVALSQGWRTKQLEYTWLRSIMDRYVDFCELTRQGLDFALSANGVDDAALREDLMSAYLTLECYPEVPAVLGALKDAGMQTAILHRICHRQIHALFTEVELERQYPTMAALLAHPAMAAFVRWVRDKPPGFSESTRKSLGVRRQR